VDAFALSLIKAERQIRKLVTHLIYQFPCFGPGDIPSLRKTLVDNRRVYFEGFEKGFSVLYPRGISDLVGSEYQRLRGRIDEAIDYRNKIFHGQLTSKNLTRDDLLAYVDDIRTWCKTLAESALAEVGYDGFGRNSFQKSTTPTWGNAPRFRSQQSRITPPSFVSICSDSRVCRCVRLCSRGKATS
jgi:hypothetical protein